MNMRLCVRVYVYEYVYLCTHMSLAPTSSKTGSHEAPWRDGVVIPVVRLDDV